MSENTILPQPSKMETSMLAKCKVCGTVIYCESFVEQDGKPVERIVTGTFRQALNSDGEPVGPVIPFCNCGG